MNAIKFVALILILQHLVPAAWVFLGEAQWPLQCTP